MKPLPSRDYVINQWTGTFIYNKITSIIIHIYVLFISYVDFRPGSQTADEMVLFGNRQSLLDVSNYLTHNLLAPSRTKSPEHSTNPTNDSICYKPMDQVLKQWSAE